MYESPFKVIVGELTVEYENEVIKAIQKVGVTVDKDEILKALNADRTRYEEAYRKGFDDCRKQYERMMNRIDEILHPTAP